MKHFTNTCNSKEALSSCAKDSGKKAVSARRNRPIRSPQTAYRTLEHLLDESEGLAG